MPSPFIGIDLAANALRAFQRQLDVTGHNIANVNTTGYSRQVADLVANDPTTFYGIHPYSVGNGVTVSTVTRVQDAFLAIRKLAAEADLGKSGTLLANLNQIETLVQEGSGAGIADALNGFFNAWSGLASNPSDSGQRIQVQQAAQTLTSRIRQFYSDLSALKTQVSGQLSQAFDDVDSLAIQVRDLNTQIRQETAKGGSPNDLLDRRDEALRKLGSLVDIHTAQFNDGTVAVYMNQFTLVDSTSAHPIPRTYDATAGTVTDGTTTFNVRSGEISGLFGTINQIDTYKTQLDNLANNLRTEVNALHSAGVNALGATGVNFFNDSVPQTGAIDFDLDAAVLADPDAIAAGSSGAAGDGGVALSLSKLRDSAVAGIGGKTFNSFYNDFVGSIGRDTAFYSTTNDTQTAVSTQIDQQIQSLSGVSLDDEMANMLRFQRSYQAAANALRIFDSVTEDLINLIHR